MISKFIDILEAIGLHPSLDDLADILWLGQELDRYSRKTKVVIEQAESNIVAEPIELREKYEPKIGEKPLIDEAILHDNVDEPEETPFDTSDFSDRENEAGSFEKERADIYSESIGREKDDLFAKAIDGIPLRVPGGSALLGKLSIGRSLRPLMMKVPSRTNFRLDEEATAERVADSDRWNPVLRPESSCWLDVVLVVDESPSMSIWRDTVFEFKELLERQGAFSNVQAKSLQYDKDNKELKLHSRLSSSLSVPISPKELVDPANRRLVIIVSDCVARYWHNGLIYKISEEWSLKNRVTLLQMLPYDLWNRTGLKKYDQVYLRNTNPHHTNDRFLIEKTSINFGLEDLLPKRNSKEKYKQDQKIPIITLESRSLFPWSKSLIGHGGLSIPGVLLQHPDKLIYEEHSEPEMDSQLDPVTVFRATASPEAYKLARYLAAVPLTLPIMRLVQRVLLPETRQIHLAEVILSRLVKIRSETARNLFVNQHGIYYDFVDDIRNRLLRDNYLSETVSVMDTVFRELSVFIDKNTGMPISFQAIVGNPLLINDVLIDDDKHPFASVSVEVLSALGGKYTHLSKVIKSHFAKKQRYKDSQLTALEIELRDVQHYIDANEPDILRALDIIKLVNKRRQLVNKRQQPDASWKDSLLFGKFKLYEGIAYFWLDKFDEAVRLLKEARGFFIAHEDQEDPIFLAENWIGYTYYRKADFNEAEGWMKHSLNRLLALLATEVKAGTKNKRNIQQRIQYTYGNLAMLYRYKGRFFKSIRYAKVAHSIVESLPRNKKEIFRSLNTLAHVLAVAGRSMEARPYLEQAEKIYKEIPDPVLGGRLYSNFCWLSHDVLEFAYLIEYYRADELRDAIESKQQRLEKTSVFFLFHAEKAVKLLDQATTVSHKELADAYFKQGELFMILPEFYMPNKWVKAERAFFQAAESAKISRFRYTYFDVLERLLTLYYLWNRAAKNLPDETRASNERKQQEYQKELKILDSELKRFPNLMGRYELALGNIDFDIALDLLRVKKNDDADCTVEIKLLKKAFKHYFSAALYKKEFNRDRYFLVLLICYNRFITLIKKQQVIAEQILAWLKKNLANWQYNISEFEDIFDYIILLHTRGKSDRQGTIEHLKQDIQQAEENGDYRRVVLLNKCLIDGYRLQAKLTCSEVYQEKLVLRLIRQSRFYRLLRRCLLYSALLWTCPRRH